MVLGFAVVVSMISATWMVVDFYTDHVFEPKSDWAMLFLPLVVYLFGTWGIVVLLNS